MKFTYVYPHRSQHCMVWSYHTISLPFLVRLEYTLSLIRLIRPSFKTHNRLLSEPSPFSIITSLGAWLLIIQSFTFLPSGSAINRDPLALFSVRVVVKALRNSQQFDYVAILLYSNMTRRLHTFNASCCRHQVYRLRSF
jgi:hypothetical protein